MRHSLAIVLVLACGCGPDPISGRLAPGAAVELSPLDEQGSYTIKENAHLTVKEGEGNGGGVLLRVPPETPATVVEDSGRDVSNPGDRQVTVKLAGGNHAGRVGTVLRNRLRPVAK